MYVCMYVCMHSCTHPCMHVCMYVCMHACMYVCMYVCIHVCMHTCMRAYLYVCACMYVCMYAWMYACMYVCMSFTHPCAMQLVGVACYSLIIQLSYLRWRINFFLLLAAFLSRLRAQNKQSDQSQLEQYIISVKSLLNSLLQWSHMYTTPSSSSSCILWPVGQNNCGSERASCRSQNFAF